MAKKKKRQSPTSSSTETNLFNKGMAKDLFPSFQSKQVWSHARNAANNSSKGDVGVIGNEPSNLHCADIPYTVIGAIHLYGDKWCIFSTDNGAFSEIGLFDDSECKYEKLVNDECLNFNKKNLIKGVSKENFDCTWQVYWDDGRNPSRTLNIDNIPWIQTITSPVGADCITYADTDKLDCERIRIVPLVDTPCLKLSKAEDGGNIRNGSYQAFIGYTVNEQLIGDYIGISNIQSLFDHEDTSGALILDVSNLDDEEFDFYELVIASNTQGEIQAKRIGLYSTQQTRVHLDNIDQKLRTISLNSLPLRRPGYEKSDSMYVVNDWLIRSGPTEQFDFNYQPLANKIKSKWISAKYPADYYYNGGNKPTFLRDEQYAFFIRWIYNTGERSSSYHIPGRAVDPAAQNPNGQTIVENGVCITSSVNSLEVDDKEFEVWNTATKTNGAALNIPTDDGGIITAEGDMGYWESSEKYPADKPDIWDDLCGTPIRHHKFPDESTCAETKLSEDDSTTINILGVRFYNIMHPVYNDGTQITNIVGYEILRGSREGNKSILAKGIFKNMRKYIINPLDLDNGIDDNRYTGLYPNFPYNDLGPDMYHSKPLERTALDTYPGETAGCYSNYADSLSDYEPLEGISRDIFTFHSPDLMFKRPYLDPYELRLYGEVHGRSTGRFVKSENHPQNKLLKNGGLIIASVFGIGYALEKMRGKSDTQYDPVKSLNIGLRNNTTGWNSVYGTTTGPWYVAAPGLPPLTGSTITTGAAAANAAISETLQIILDGIIEELIEDGQSLLDVATGGAMYDWLIGAQFTAENAINEALYPGSIGAGQTKIVHGSAWKEAPTTFKWLTGIFTFVQFAAEGSQVIIDAIYSFISMQDFAWKYDSYGLFNEFEDADTLKRFRDKLDHSGYIDNTFIQFGLDHKINNLYRPKTVVISTEHKENTGTVIFPDPNTIDDSRIVLGTLSQSTNYAGQSVESYDDPWKDPTNEVERTISAQYGALKFSFSNQYGQLDGIRQIPIRSCVQILPETPRLVYESDPMFGGDNYINRYTEKCIMPIFWDFLMGQPDMFPYDYKLRQNIQHPRYWMNTERYQVSQMFYEMVNNPLSMISSFEDSLPAGLFYMDTEKPCGGFLGLGDSSGSMFHLKNAYMYTHSCGVNDFFVESEVNVAHRDWLNDDPKTRHYDWKTYTDYIDIFDSSNIKNGNFYKYDYSLSISKFFSNLISFGEIQARDYDPETAETCWTYYPKRLVYSLQAQREAKKDFWRVFLPLNYRDFKSVVNVIKPVSKSGALVLFPYLSPQQFQGIDQLKMDSGNKITIGDGGLFSQPFQNIVNSDISNEYGSCESQRSVINTPSGLFYISQAQGKIFHYTGKLENIANRGMKWWFNKYLPSKLLKLLPELEGTLIADNPVVGIGCQSIYDPNDDIVYFCKKDYDILEEFQGCILYDPEEGFQFNLTACNDYPPSFSCPPGYTYNSTTGLCEKLDQVAPGRDCPDGYTWNGKQCELVDCVTINYEEPCPDGYTEVSLTPPTKECCKYDLAPEILACPPGYTETTNSAGQTICEKLLTLEPTEVPVTFNIELGDPMYFKDISWTVSYDPKASAWISFHDWHPELCLPSINHFMTTKTFALDEPECPEGYVYNAQTGLCEKIEYIQPTVINTLDESPAIPSGTPLALSDCSNQYWGDYGVAVYKPGYNQYGAALTYTQSTPPWVSGPNGLTWNHTPPPAGYPTAGMYGFTYIQPFGPGNWWHDYNPSAGNPGFINALAKWPDCGTGLPKQTWLSFVIPIEVQQTKTYYIALAADNFFRFSVDGTQITAVEWDSSGVGIDPNSSEIIWQHFVGDDVNGNNTYYPVGMPSLSDNDQRTQSNTVAFRILHIYPVELTTGCHELQLEAKNEASAGMFACAVFDNTESEIINSTSINDLNVVFSSEDATTIYAGSNGFSCPDGSAPVFDENGCNPTCFTGELTITCPEGCTEIINGEGQIVDCECIKTSEPYDEKGSIWKHNIRCDSYGNYYDVQYPWEVELIETSGQAVDTVRSLEYQLECFVYKGDLDHECGDRWHDLNFNFDELIIHNSEQVSGLLRLNLRPPLDPIAALQYPIIGLNDIDILYSKEEQKYRVNQFWDITNDRGEFSNAEQRIWITELNGYIRDLNANNLDYNKPPEQHKKFRHYYNFALLRRNNAQNRKMLLKLVNSKLNYSYR